MLNDKFIFEENYCLKADEIRKKMVEMSFYKYGSAKKNFGDKLVETLPTCELCVEKYKNTGNKEFLLDAMNYLMFEFMYPQKEGAFFKATDSGDSAGIVGVSYNDILSEVEDE